jgi:hypothetical protein
MKFSQLLNLLGRYRFRCEIKGGFRSFRSKRIIITTSRSPEETYVNLPDEDLNQLLRRIDIISEYSLSQSQELGNTIPNPKRLYNY